MILVAEYKIITSNDSYNCCNLLGIFPYFLKKFNFYKAILKLFKYVSLVKSFVLE